MDIIEPAVVMIHFSCRCKHVFDVPEEMAGRPVQCPQCLLLVDVPTHDELEQLTEEGTFRVEEFSPADEPDRFEDLKRAYSREKVDEEGVEFDLRQTPQQIAGAGTEEPVEGYEALPFAPKYDPETGELIRPLDVREDPTLLPHPSQIPMAQALVNYARPELNPQVSLVKPLLRLLTPVNLAAMFFVLLVHLFVILANFALILGIFVIVTAAVGLIAHYANVVDEIAIADRDELPSFLRHFSLSDDIWLPFMRVLMTWAICFGPAAIASAVVAKYWSPKDSWACWIAMDIVGLIFLPAVGLTILTSGSLTNLRPDRVIGTILQIGPKYVLLVITYTVAIFAYGYGFYATIDNFSHLVNSGPSRQWLEDALGAYGSLLSGIYLTHYFSWILGLCYRIHHVQFPWVFQYREPLIRGVVVPHHASPADKSAR